MKWIKAAERMPTETGWYHCRKTNSPAKHVYFCNVGDIYTAFVDVRSHEDVEWLDESEPPKFIVAEVREYLDQMDKGEITFSRFVELLNERPGIKSNTTPKGE